MAHRHPTTQQKLAWLTDTPQHSRDRRGSQTLHNTAKTDVAQVHYTADCTVVLSVASLKTVSSLISALLPSLPVFRVQTMNGTHATATA